MQSVSYANRSCASLYTYRQRPDSRNKLLKIAKAATSFEVAACEYAWVGLGEHVDSGFDQRVAAVVIEQTAGDFFELLVANDFRILRSDFVVHGRWIVEVVVGFRIVLPD